MDVRTLIKEYLEREKMMHLATMSGGKPWVCNVWFAADDELNLYWFSGINRRHSAEVAANPHVAGGIVFDQAPEDSPRGIQFEDTATKLTDTVDIDLATGIYAGRIFPPEKIQAFRDNQTNPHDFYCITPRKFVLFDTVNFPYAPLQEFMPNKDTNS